MKALAVHSATNCITFIAKNIDKKAILSLDVGMHQSEKVVPGIQYVLEQVGLTPAELEFTSLCLGPGSFTGLRISFAALKAFELAYKVPVYGIPTLETFFYPFKEFKGAILPVIDAKKDCFYASVYRSGIEITEPMDADINTIASLLDPEEQIIAIGYDAEYFKECLHTIRPGQDIITFTFTDSGIAEALLEIGNQRFLNKEKGLQEYEGPVYIRKSEAELSLEKS
jgi:tRNA threonylcarbamoyladenosine biosynthesis protein TsaB